MKKLSIKPMLSIIVLMAMIVTLDACKKETDRDKFLGGYNVSETCTNSVDSYYIEITELETDEDAVIIRNLWNWGDFVTAEISGSNIDIPQQNINGIVYIGDGSKSGSTLTIDLTISDGSSAPETCTLVCVRQ